MRRNRRTAVVSVCFLMVLTTLGFCSSNKGLYLSAITEALGLKRSLFAINDSIRFIVSAVVSLFFGSMIRRFGPRRLIAAGFVSLICSVLLYSFSSGIMGFYLGGALLGFGLSWTTTSMVGYLIGKWCPENRGTIMGFVLAANGIGGALAAQIVSPIIYQEGNPFGYRSAYRLVACILLLAGAIVVAVVREPENADAAAFSHKKRRGRQWSGISLKEAEHRPYFYIAVASVFLTGMVLQSVNGVGAAHMRDAGLNPAFVANVWSIHSLVLAGAKFFTGFLYDKKGMRVTILLCQLVAVASIFSMIFVDTSSTGKLLAAVYCVISSFALPLETIMVPLIASDLFGEKAYARIMGILLAFNTGGYAVGSPLTNYVYDRTGSYVPMFYALAGIMAAVIVLFQIALHKAEIVRAQVEAAEGETVL